MGRDGVCQMRITRREMRIGTCRGAVGEEDAATGGATSEVAGEALTSPGLAAGSLPAAEGGGFEEGVE